MTKDKTAAAIGTKDCEGIHVRQNAFQRGARSGERRTMEEVIPARMMASLDKLVNSF